MKRWYAFSGILSRTLSSTTEVTGSQWEVVNSVLRQVVATFSTLSDAEDYITEVTSAWKIYLRIREVSTQITVPASSRGVAVVPLNPLPLFRTPGTVLTTRGFWDVTSITSPAGTVSNFAFGMLFLPVSVVYERQAVPKHTFAEQYLLRSMPDVPDPLLDDPGWFAYDSFVRVTTDVNQDPPFHSKSKRKYPANSVLCVVAGVEVAVQGLTSLRLNMGIRFRVLVDS